MTVGQDGKSAVRHTAEVGWPDALSGSPELADDSTVLETESADAFATKNDAVDAAIARIRSRRAVVGVVGLGLPFAVEKAKVGFKVIRINPIVTHHSGVDYGPVVERAAHVVNTRRATRHVPVRIGRVMLL